MNRPMPLLRERVCCYRVGPYKGMNLTFFPLLCTHTFFCPSAFCHEMMQQGGLLQMAAPLILGFLAPKLQKINGYHL